MEIWDVYQKPKFNDLVKIIKSSNILLLFIIAIALIIINIFFKQNIFGLFIYSILFVIFDSLGWHYIILVETNYARKLLIISNSTDVSDLFVSKIAYRVMQTMFQWLMLVPVYFLWDLSTAISCLVLWWFGFDDLLYYFALGVSLNKESNFNLLKSWSVHLLYKGDVTKFLFVFFSILGLIISILILFFVKI